MPNFKDYLKEVEEKPIRKTKLNPKKDIKSMKEDADFDQGKKDGKPTKMKGPIGNNYDAMSLQGRADIKQRVVTARQGDNPLEEDEDHETMLDSLHEILNNMGADDDVIKAGVDIDLKGKQKIAARLGIAADTVDTLIASLQQHLESDPNERMIQEEPIDGGEYSYEADALGNITIRNSSGEDKFIQGSEATTIANEIEKYEGKPELQEVLRKAFNQTNVFEGFFLNEFREENFDAEIEADSGTYNMPWKLDNASGTMTVFYTVSNKKPELKIQSIRNNEGDEIDVDHITYDELMVQAKNFIGKE